MEEQEQKPKLYISSTIADNLPSMVKNELARMSAQKQEEFVEEFDRKTKSTLVAYLMMIFIIGTHYAYLKKWGLQLAFWFSAYGLGIWWIIDLFRVPGLIKDYNKDVASDIMRNLKAISS